MAQLALLFNPRPHRSACIGCAQPLDVPSGYRLFAGDLAHAICDRCASKVDANLVAERNEANRLGSDET